MSRPLQGAPTVPLDEGSTATLSTVTYLGLGPLITLTLWTERRVTWQSWQPYWNIRPDPWRASASITPRI